MNIDWHPAARDFAEATGLDIDIVEAVVRVPQRTEEDPHHADKDYPVKRLKRGDIAVTVGYQDEDRPMILFVHFAGNSSGRGNTPRRSVGNGKGSSTPPTKHELHRRIGALGYAITVTGPHAKVVSQSGKTIATLPRTPSDHRSIANSWHTFLRAHEEFVGGDTRGNS